MDLNNDKVEKYKNIISGRSPEKEKDEILRTYSSQGFSKQKDIAIGIFSRRNYIFDASICSFHVQNINHKLF